MTHQWRIIFKIKIEFKEIKSSVFLFSVSFLFACHDVFSISYLMPCSLKHSDTCWVCAQPRRFPGALSFSPLHNSPPAVLLTFSAGGKEASLIFPCTPSLTTADGQTPADDAICALSAQAEDVQQVHLLCGPLYCHGTAWANPPSSMSPGIPRCRQESEAVIEQIWKRTSGASESRKNRYPGTVPREARTYRMNRRLKLCYFPPRVGSIVL